jgi:3D (Asp-Asp-Asp) domain-containing protein
VRFHGARRRPAGGAHTWHFCLAALAALVVVAAVASARSAAAAPADADAKAVARTVAGGPAVRGGPAPDSLGAAAGRALPALDEPEAGEPPAPEPQPAMTPSRAAPSGLTSPAEVVGRLGISRQGRQFRAQVTAYSASEEEGTAWGITRSGTRARPGVVAVDPAVIPLGSHVRIAGLPGTYRAEDTGGGIHGAHLDVFMDSRADALRFGRQTGVLVEVLE